MTGPLYGAIEAGGTKFVCAAARAHDRVIEECRIETVDPASTLRAVEQFFVGVEGRHGRFEAFGIATFGPVDLREASPTFGHILATPKAGWANTDLVTPIADRFQCEVAIDTDVNAAALAEATYGAGRGCGTVVYVTVGTGIGAGVVVDGHSLKGLLHPEIGHIAVNRHPKDARFAGVCPFHGDCLEGLASGTAIVERYGAPLNQLATRHEAREVIGDYLGQLVATVIMVLSAERIIFGGGVMSNLGLLEPIRAAAERVLKGYPSAGSDSETLARIVVRPGLNGRSGIAGAVELARLRRKPS